MNREELDKVAANSLILDCLSSDEQLQVLQYVLQTEGQKKEVKE